MQLGTIVAAIEAGVALIPEGLKLIGEAKELLSAEDKATVVARLDVEADAAHRAA